MILTYRYGHNELCQGAIAFCNEVIEDRRYGSRVIQLLTEAGNNCINCTPPPMADADEELVYGVNMENQYNSDVFLSFHIDSASPSAYGAETCVYQNSGLANSISNGILNNLSNIGFYNRGIKERPDLYEPRATNAVCIIIEPFFLSNKEDTARYMSNFEAFCRCIANGIDGRVPLQVPQPKPVFTPPQDFVFCAEYYLKNNPDVAKAGVDPYQHYINCGWLEGRKPSEDLPKDFTEGEYLFLNPDLNQVVTNNQCPSGKWHWKMFGYKEGRQYKVVNKSVEQLKSEEINKIRAEEKAKVKSQIDNILNQLNNLR